MEVVASLCQYTIQALRSIEGCLVERIFGGYCLCWFVFFIFFLVTVCVAPEEWLHMKIVIMLIAKCDHIGLISF